MAEIEMKQLIHCALCPNMCRFDCPVLRAEKNESVAPSFKARLMYLLKQGFVEPDSELADIAFRCVGCEGCETWCEFPEVDLPAWMRDWRSELTRTGLVPEAVRRLAQTLRSEGRPLGRPDECFSFGHEKAMDRPVEFIYFAGCTAAHWRKETVQATLAIFDAAGLGYRVLPAEPCCGYAAMAIGETGLAREMAERAIEVLGSSGVAMLVTGCPECYEMFTVQYPQLGLDLGPEVVHSTEIFGRLLREGRLHLKERSERIAVHDPCVLGRKLERYDAIRELLARIPGVEAVELRHNREKARCCGGGDMMAEINPALSQAIAREKAAELEASGASRAVTACPHCERNLDGAGSISVLDVADLLAERLESGGERE